MTSTAKIIIFILVLVVLYEIFSITIIRDKKRKRIYNLAKQRSYETGKPILVIGDPYNDNKSLSKPNYGCGAVCVDLTGCPLCPIGIKKNLIDYLPTLPDNSYVIFSSCVINDDFPCIGRFARVIIPPYTCPIA